MPESHQALGCGVVVVLDTVFVPHDLTVKFVDQVVHSGIQVFVRAFREQVATLHVNAALGTLASFFFLLIFHSEEYFDIDHLVKMSGDPI
jgi:hypothetical protein